MKQLILTAIALVAINGISFGQKVRNGFEYRQDPNIQHVVPAQKRQARTFRPIKVDQPIMIRKGGHLRPTAIQPRKYKG